MDETGRHRRQAVCADARSAGRFGHVVKGGLVKWRADFFDFFFLPEWNFHAVPPTNAVGTSFARRNAREDGSTMMWPALRLLMNHAVPMCASYALAKRSAFPLLSSSMSSSRVRVPESEVTST